MPVTVKEAWEKIAEEFWEKWKFPNSLGAIDGKYVMIQAPLLVRIGRVQL